MQQTKMFNKRGNKKKQVKTNVIKEGMWRLKCYVKNYEVWNNLKWPNMKCEKNPEMKQKMSDDNRGNVRGDMKSDEKSDMTKHEM